MIDRCIQMLLETGSIPCRPSHLWARCTPTGCSTATLPGGSRSTSPTTSSAARICRRCSARPVRSMWCAPKCCWRPRAARPARVSGEGPPWPGRGAGGFGGHRHREGSLGGRSGAAEPRELNSRPKLGWHLRILDTRRCCTDMGSSPINRSRIRRHCQTCPSHQDTRRRGTDISPSSCCSFNTAG